MRGSFLQLVSSLCVSSMSFSGEPPSEYLHPTIREPLMDMISLEVPGEIGNQELAKLGFVDVTAPPFAADPMGRKDSTAGLQKAVDFARDHQMVCFLPAGTYRISDTLSCIQNHYLRQNGKFFGAPMHPNVLLGSTADPDRRATILLAPHSKGFSDPGNPRYVVHFWARRRSDPEKPQPNISFNQTLIGIDIVIGEGNPGAVAVRHRAAQGSSIQDCSIDATHGLKGLEGGAGSGGSHIAVRITGGRIGADLLETQPAPTITGLTLIDQTETAILYGGRQALSAVGIKIVSRSRGPLVKVRPEWDAYMQGPVCFVDSGIEFRSRGRDNVAFSSTRSIYLRNVYLKNASHAVLNPDGSGVKGNPAGWMHIREYAHRMPAPPYKGYTYESPVYVDGERSLTDVQDLELGEVPPRDLQSRHLWGDGFPTWETPGTVNVKMPPYNAKGDGYSDDTEVLQRAIDENEVIFLPKGLYRVTRTLQLKRHTKIIGIGQCFSLIIIRDDTEFFADAENPRPVVQTADDKDSDTVLAFCGIYVPFEVPGAYALKWQGGRRSVFRSAGCWLKPFVGYGTRIPEHDPRTTPFVLITGKGGGRWYNFNKGGGPAEKDYRHVLVKGTTERLDFYHICPEGARSDANMAIRDSRNVSIYGFKCEANAYALWVRNSDNIRVFGYGGNASAREGSCLFKIENTPNFVLANIVDHPSLAGVKRIYHSSGTDPKKWFMVMEDTPEGNAVRTRPLDRPVLYRRGHP